MVVEVRELDGSNREKGQSKRFGRETTSSTGDEPWKQQR